MEERKTLAEIQGLPKEEKPPVACPFQSTSERQVNCNKPHGTCSFRLYERSQQTGKVTVAAGDPGQIRAFCPKRYEQDATIYKWVGEEVLGCKDPVVLKEIGFLESPPTVIVSDSAVFKCC